jgi:hypothetical protein
MNLGAKRIAKIVGVGLPAHADEDQGALGRGACCNGAPDSGRSAGHDDRALASANAHFGGLI